MAARVSEILLPWDGAPDEIVGPNVELLGADAFLWSAKTKAWVGAFNRTLQSEVDFQGYNASYLGRGASWGRSASGGADHGNAQPLSSNSGVTILAVASPADSINIKTLDSQRSASGNVPQINLIANATAAFGEDHGAMMLYCRETAANVTPVIATGGNAGVDGTPHCWVAANDTGGNGYIFRDGVALTLGTNTALSGGTYVDTTQEVRVGNLAAYSTNGNFVCDDPIYLLVKWPRLIPPAMARDLSRILRRSLGPAFAPRRMSVFRAPAATYPVLSAATVANITATTVTPRVTITI